MAIKKGDFIEIEYTGRTSDDNVVFDTTQKSVAEAEHLHSRKNFHPVIICVGEGHILGPLDEALIGKELGKHTIALKEPLGKKDAKLLQLVPMKAFKKENLQPVVGMEVTIDDQQGIIRTISGGRVIVDFNHPLASKDLTYELDIKRVVTDAAEQIKALLTMIRIPFGTVDVKESEKGKSAEVSMPQELPPQLIDLFTKDIVRLTGVTDVLFKTVKAENKEKV